MVRSRVATWFREVSRGKRDSWEAMDAHFGESLLSEKEQEAAAMSTDAAYAQDEVFTIKLSRNESGLGLVFDSDFVVTKLHPGCAAERHGGVHIGDTLLAVDGVELHPGDRVGALFPMHVPTFELRLLRASGVSGIPKAMPASKGDVAPTKKPRRMHHAQRVASRREQSGKFEASRPAPVFQEVVWNEYCVLFPDGSSAPFNESVRYTALTGYLRKKPVVTDGRAEWALLHGESQRGWSRHFCHLSMKQLAWFDEDPQLAMERQRTAKNSNSFRTKAKEMATSYKMEHSSGKARAGTTHTGVGSALLYAAPCRLYVSRLYRNEFALSFGGNSLLLLQAASGADAQDWVVALAACLFFSSAAFEAVLAECRRFFDAAQKTIQGRLSTIEALDLVRAMGREITYSQVVDAADVVAPEGGWFGIREFTYLVRTVCADADPRSELLRAFRLLDTKADSRQGTGDFTAAAAAVTGGDAESASAGVGYISKADLTATMRAAGVPDEHVFMVIRAAGADRGDERIPYTKLADALYPAAATAAKRRRTMASKMLSPEERQLEVTAREAWEAQREEILASAVAGTEEGGGAAVLPPPLVAGRGANAPTGAPVTLTFGSGAAPTAAPTIPPLGLSRAAAGAARQIDATQLTPRGQEIYRSINEQPAGQPATPRTIADRVLRARKASEVSKAKAASELSRRLSSGASPGGPSAAGGAAEEADRI